jgi:hypothetical protein
LAEFLAREPYKPVVGAMDSNDFNSAIDCPGVFNGYHAVGIFGKCGSGCNLVTHSGRQWLASMIPRPSGASDFQNPMKYHICGTKSVSVHPRCGQSWHIAISQYIFTQDHTEIIGECGAHTGIQTWRMF